MFIIHSFFTTDVLYINIKININSNHVVVVVVVFAFFFFVLFSTTNCIRNLCKSWLTIESMLFLANNCIFENSPKISFGPFLIIIMRPSQRKGMIARMFFWHDGPQMWWLNLSRSGIYFCEHKIHQTRLYSPRRDPGVI